jgi:hypothetical protein
MIRSGLLFLVAAACGGARPAETATAPAPAAAPGSPTASTPAAASTPAPAPTLASAPTPSPTSAPPAPPTGGSVLVGDIPGTKKFDPKPVVEENKPAMVDCYNKARAVKPSLSGKVKLLIVVNATGNVVKVDAEPGGAADDPTLVACIGEALKTVSFPKPGGMATIVAPLLFRP